MEFRDVIDLVHAYESDVAEHPSNMGRKFGCDCGCGGDTYSAEDLEELDKAEAETMEAVHAFCIKYGIEYTGGYS